MADEKYSKRQAEEEELLRRLEVDQLKEMVAKKTKEEREEVKIVVGSQSFSLNQLLKEADKGTKIGKLFLDTQARLRIEKRRRGI